MENKHKLLIVIFGWLLLNLLTFFIPIQSQNQVIGWMITQQLWLVFGSLLVIKDRKILQWNFSEVGWGIIAGVGIFLGNSLLNAITVTSLSYIYGSDQVTQWLSQEQAGIQLLLSVEQPQFIIVAFLMTIGAPLSEELFFRGALLSELRGFIPEKKAIVITALCFALVHFYVIQALPVFISGLILGILFIAKGSLIRPLVAHATVNMIALLIYSL